MRNKKNLQDKGCSYNRNHDYNQMSRNKREKSERHGNRLEKDGFVRK